MRNKKIYIYIFFGYIGMGLILGLVMKIDFILSKNRINKWDGDYMAMADGGTKAYSRFGYDLYYYHELYAKSPDNRGFKVGPASVPTWGSIFLVPYLFSNQELTFVKSSFDGAAQELH